MGITLASLSALANFFFIPFYPFWALTVITLDIFVIWALGGPWESAGGGIAPRKPRSGMATATSASKSVEPLRRLRGDLARRAPGAGAARFTLPRVIGG